VRDGRVIKEAFTTGLPKPSTYLVFNTRRAMFSDVRVREALLLLFDFEWINHSYFFDLYRRTGSFFEDSELSARGRPADARERAAAPFPGTVRAGLRRRGPHRSPTARARPRARSGARSTVHGRAELRGTELVERKSGRPFTFEILVTARDEERLALLFTQSLKRAGIAARVRMVDAVQYEGRRLTYDFDMIENRWDQSLSPGNEQAFYWGSAAADQPGTRNYMGVRAAVDAMIAAPQGGKPRGFRRGGARARPHADLRLLRHPAVSSSRAVDRALEHDRPACHDFALAIFRKPGGAMQRTVISGDFTPLQARLTAAGSFVDEPLTAIA
jgi:peptide/nickel transport system substrate-binding protein